MSTDSELIGSLSSTAIIPDIVPTPTHFTPTVLFTVVWPTGDESLIGNELARSSVLEEPNIRITPLNLPENPNGGATTYTLVLTDPDAPSRADPKFRQFRHWVVTGLQIPSSNSDEFALKTKPATTPYRPPGPPPGTGFHRYTFLLFEEPENGIEIPQGAVEYGSQLEERRSWDALKFGETYGLKLVGANFFLCQPPSD